MLSSLEREGIKKNIFIQGRVGYWVYRSCLKEDNGALNDGGCIELTTLRTSD